MILSLPFKISPARHRLGIIDEQLRDRILVARKAFAENLPEEYRDGIEFFDVDGFNTAATLQDNILFGKLAYGQAGGAERVGEIMSAVIDDLDLRTAVMEVGLGFHVESVAVGYLGPSGRSSDRARHYEASRCADPKRSNRQP